MFGTTTLPHCYARDDAPTYVMSIKNSCAFTGHRKIEESFDGALLEYCIRRVIGKGVTDFYCGMAMGFDMLAAEAVLSLKREFPEIRLIACVPCPNQSRFFSQENKDKYEEILAKCDEVRVLHDHYFRGCMLVRDRYMVDNCAYLIAYLRTPDGGTNYTLDYASINDKEVFVL